MKKILLLIIHLLVILFCGCQTNENETRIGVILPLTGVSAELGVPMLEAMQIAEHTINDSIIKFGGKKIKLLIEDGKSTANGAIAAFQKLRYNNPSAFIIFGDIPCSNLAASVSKYDYPVIALAAAAENIPTLSDRYFRAWTATSSASNELASFAKNNLAKNKCAIFSVDNNYGNEFAASIKKSFIDAGGEVLISETYDLSAQDIKMQIQKIIAKNPEVIFVVGFGSGYLAAFNQLRSMSYRGPLLTDETITIPEYYKAVANALDSTYFSSTTFDPNNSETESYKNFVWPFKKKIGVNPNAHSVFGYVSVSILADVIRRYGSDPQKIEKGLLELRNFESIIGKLTYLPNRELNIPIVIRQIYPDGTFAVIRND